jgi:hypothetical protein
MNVPLPAGTAYCGRAKLCPRRRSNVGQQVFPDLEKLSERSAPDRDRRDGATKPFVVSLSNHTEYLGRW